jgi:hypothetical protein
VSVLGLLCTIFLSTAVAQTVHNVPGDYSTIQSAIDASADGDTVLVGPGTYYEQIDVGNHQITVQSSAGPATTTIDASFLGPVVTFGASATRTATLSGFTITHGQAQLSGGGGVTTNGGSPTIQGNVITNNYGEGFGNGIALLSSAALVTGNTISNNTVHGASGGGGGGGIGVLGSPCVGCGAEIRNNVIENNSILNFTTGGGIYVNGGGSVVIIDNVIRGNVSPSEGGGIGMVNTVDAQIENNLIVDNQGNTGGGVYWLTPSGTRGPYLVGNTIVGNQALDGSGVYADGNDSAARIINNMIVATNGTTGIECGTSGAETPAIAFNDAYATAAAAYGTCSTGAGTGGNISAQPIFLGPGDYRLAQTSPGIDVGSNLYSTQTTDLLGYPRLVDGNSDGFVTIDMGAYEWQDEIFHGDFEP